MRQDSSRREEEWLRGWERPEDRRRRGERWPALGRSGRRFGSQPNEPRSGAHVERGPKGYARTDQRLYEEVCERLMRHPEVDASDIEVSVEEGVVRFRGTVPDRRTKFLVEDLAEGVLGVRDLVNELRLRRD